MIRRLAPALLLLTAAAPPAPSPTYDRAIAAGYKAATYCSGIFNAGRSPAQIDAEELRGIYPEYESIVGSLHAEVKNRSVLVRFDDALPPRVAASKELGGCTIYPIGTPPDEPNPDIVIGADDRPIKGWPQDDYPERVVRPRGRLAAALATAFASNAPTDTTVVVVILDGKLVGERYASGFSTFTSQRTWSVAKSLTGTIVGVAAREGLIDPAAPAPVPEWQTPGDPRQTITLDNLLRMASGLHSGAAGNRTDAIYFGGTAVNEEATAWPLEAKPGSRFRYANDDILLAAHVLRYRTAKRMDSGGIEFISQTINRLEMRHTVAETDWRGNYVLSSQVWSTARDLARLGQFWLQDGVWQGQRLLPEGWMTYMTTPSGPQPAEGPGYGATLWLFGPKQGLPAGSYAAQGNRGQFIMVVPSEKLVVVRRGEDPGAARFDIAAFTAKVIEALK